MSGTEDYTVKLTIKNGVIAQHQCDCPYVLGSVCKHVVAVVFGIMESEWQLLAPKPKKEKAAAKPKSMSVAQQIKTILKNVSHEELMEYVEIRCKKDLKFKNDFLTVFSKWIPAETLSFAHFKKQIQSILKSAKDKYGHIPSYKMKFVSENAAKLVDLSEKYYSEKQLDNLFFLSAALLESFTEALQFADDSYGEIGYFIDESLSKFDLLTDEDLSDKLRKDLYDYCISSYQKKIFEGWDWHLGMLNYASKLAKTEAEYQEILALMELIFKEYDKKTVQVSQITLYRRFRPDKVDSFLKENIENDILRRSEIAIAFERNDFEYAKELALYGIAKETDGRRILSDDYSLMLDIALAQNDTKNIVFYARLHFLNFNYYKKDVYQMMKENVPKEDWNAFLEEIINETRDNSIKEKIFIKEAWWERLCKHLLEVRPSLRFIKEYEKYLAKDYSPQLIMLYKENLETYLDTNVSRDYYKEVCQYLRRMKKIGGNEEANQLIALYRGKFGNRRALMEELAKV